MTMQAIISQEEWEQFQALRKQPAMDQKQIDLKVKEALEHLRDMLKTKRRVTITTDDLADVFDVAISAIDKEYPLGAQVP